MHNVDSKGGGMGVENPSTERLSVTKNGFKLFLQSEAEGAYNSHFAHSALLISFGIYIHFLKISYYIAIRWHPQHGDLSHDDGHEV